jgi:4-hydroxybutyryl-CoA dehydratase / vinylacetyl-CoA-Delta-isomerase
MALRTPGQYIASLRDGRQVFFRGERVDDVTTHPIIGTAVKHAAIDYEIAESPEYRDLAIIDHDGTAFSRYYGVPTTSDELLKRSALVEACTRAGATLVTLIKEIGTDALLGMRMACDQVDRVAGTEYAARVSRYHAYCRDNDLALAVAQTDVKGDRGLGPSEQHHPDYYVRVAERRSDGIVVRGAKVHTSVSTNANEIIVLPTRNMSAADADYAVAFAVPANAPGLTMLASPYGAVKRNSFEHPISSSHKMMETLTIFEDVFVPWERVFLCGEWQGAGPVARDFVEYHRFTAVSYKLPLVDALVGSAYLVADLNGIARASHVREKVTWLVCYAETLRHLTHMAALKCKEVEPGQVVPDPLLVNMAKLHFATNYHQAVAHLQDLAGGLLVTGPGGEDWENPELRPYLDRYFGGSKGVSAEERLRALNMISDLTASDYGGYQEVLAIHAEGSIEAERLTIFRAYDSDRAIRYARELAGI